MTSGQLAQEYGFTDIDATQPDVWRYIEVAHDAGAAVNIQDFR